MVASYLVKCDLTNVAISLWWLLKPVSVKLVPQNESGLFDKIKSMVGLCVFVIKVYFLIKDLKLSKLQNFPNLPWLLFEIPIFILNSPVKIIFLYDSLTYHNELNNSKPLGIKADLFFIGKS